MVRNEDERAQALRDMGAEVVVGNLLDLDSMHRVIAGYETMYFGMSVSDAYLAATSWDSLHTRVWRQLFVMPLSLATGSRW